MATLHLICGLPGSGKTTLARELETTGAMWLSPDAWMSRIVGNGYDEERREAVEAVQWELAQRLLKLGVDVILDNGFWAADERARYRTDAQALGAWVRLHFLDVPMDELKRRLAIRNRALPDDSFAVSEADIERWARLFEPPTADELA